MSNPTEAAPIASRTDRFFHSLLAVLFPDQCRLCAEPLQEWTRVPVCRRCLQDLQPLRTGAGLCHCCGIPRQTALGPLCARCAAGEYDFDQARSFGAYEGALREVVHLFKYHGMRPLAAPLAERLAAVFRQQQWDGAEFFGLVAVPLAPGRLRQRGFNQAHLLARELGAPGGVAGPGGHLPARPCHLAADRTDPGAAHAKRARRLRSGSPRPAVGPTASSCSSMMC